jgi:hypothetical protein
MPLGTVLTLTGERVSALPFALVLLSSILASFFLPFSHFFRFRFRFEGGVRVLGFVFLWALGTTF